MSSILIKRRCSIWITITFILLIPTLTVTENIEDKVNNFYKNQKVQHTPNIDSLNGYTIHQPQRSTTTSNQYDASSTSSSDNQDTPHSRKKRLIWVTDDGRLALPPGTTLSFSPTIALPFVRYPPEGFLSNMTISLPITIDFDKLGLTDNANPLGTIPDYLGRSVGRAAGTMLGQYVSRYLNVRKKREILDKNENQNFNQNKKDGGSAQQFTIKNERIDDVRPTEEELEMPKLPSEHKHAFHGGERALLYTVVEDFLTNFGLDGKACLLRAICEVHSKPVHHLGLLGEMLKLFFTASKSPYSELLDEYVSAERVGGGVHGPGECFPYYKECPKSLFKISKNKYQNKDDLEAAQYSDKYQNGQPDYGTNEINSSSISM